MCNAMRHSVTVPVLALAGALAAPPAPAQETAADLAPELAALVQAYPAFLDRVDGNDLVWRDGTRMPVHDGRAGKTFEALLDTPDIGDQFYVSYPLGRRGVPPPPNSDPGRVRYAPLFEKMYGRCREGETAKLLTDVVWLPAHGGRKVTMTRVNGAADRLAAVSRALDRLPERFLRYLSPPAGTYNCRVIAGTGRTSAHGYGIAIDINARFGGYWRWARPSVGGRNAYVSRIPWEIIEIFEENGFIWGGKWHHYDTMHFEYRPELIAAARARATAPPQPGSPP